MPTKAEIKANATEAKQLRKLLTSNQRENLKATKYQRSVIRKAEKYITALELDQDRITKKINRRLAILEGRNEA